MDPSEVDGAHATHQVCGTGAHMSDAELFAFTQFYDSGRLIEDAMAKHLAEEHAMTIADYEVLVRLDGESGQMRLAVLADRCITSMPDLTQTLVRLEDRGWIRREKAVGDALGALAHLLPAGAAALAAAAPKHAEIIKQRLLGSWTAAELEIIGQAMAASTRALRAARS